MFFKEHLLDFFLLDNVVAVILTNPFFHVGVITLCYSRTVNNFENQD